MIFKKSKLTESILKELLEEYPPETCGISIDIEDEDDKCDCCNKKDTYSFIDAFDQLIGILDRIAEELDKEDDKPEPKPELKRCPICGSSVHTYCADDGYWYLACGYCPLETKAIFETEDEAIAYWNDRD